KRRWLRFRLMTLLVLIACSIANPIIVSADPSEVDVFAFIDGFRISYYLTTAVQMQKLPPCKRAEALRKMAADPKHASELFPLCQMLFEAKDRMAIRRPGIGSPAFVGPQGAYSQWPLEPITLRDDVPILIVRGYMLGGEPESPDSYLDYCLANCRW